MQMKLKELLGQSSEFDHVEVTGVTNDSRKIKKGMVFVCLQGTQVDGHRYALQAEAAGAAVIVAERDTGAKNQIIVENSRHTYARLCSAFFGHPASRMKIVGITGTNGKTTTSLLLKWVLEQQGHKVGLIGTIQNIVGEQVLPANNTTPDAYEIHSLLALMEKAGCDYVVMEVSSHALDQDRVYGLEFEAGIFTNLTQDHLDYHKTMQAYLDCKKKLFSMSSCAIVNLDDPSADQIISSAKGKVVTYSANRDDSHYSAKNIRHLPGGVSFEMVGDGVIGRVKLPIPGEFSVYNALAAGVCALSLGCPFQGVLDALSSAEGVKGRVEVVPTDRDFTVIIDYAHTPDGLLNVTRAMNKVKTGRLVTLFGCGGDRDRTKRPLMGKIAAEESDFVIVTSDNPRSEDPDTIISEIVAGMEGCDTPYEVIEDRRKAIAYALEHAQKDDLILLAGKGHETYQILPTGTVHLDEREVVADVLASMK